MAIDLIRLVQRLALLAVVVVALVATGFSHRPPRVADQALELALAQGMTSGDLCGDRTRGQPHADQHCLACQIAGSAGLPSSMGELRKLDLAVLVVIPAPRESPWIAGVLDRANGPQGPPAA